MWLHHIYPISLNKSMGSSLIHDEQECDMWCFVRRQIADHMINGPYFLHSFFVAGNQWLSHGRIWATLTLMKLDWIATAYSALSLHHDISTVTMWRSLRALNLDLMKADGQ